MRVLFVIPYVPSLIRVRPYNLIRHLSEAGHQVTLLTLWSDDAEQGAIDQIQPYCQQIFAYHLSTLRPLINCLASVPGQLPLQAAYCWHPDLADFLIDLAHSSDEMPRFDVVHVEHLRGARFGLHLLQHEKNGHGRSRSGTPIVWDSVDCISHLFRLTAKQTRKRISRWMAQMELQRTERFEGWVANQFDRVLVTSSADRQAFVQLMQSEEATEKIRVLTNGVDLSYFTPGTNGNRDQASLVVTGKMSYHANVTMSLELIERIMPRVWAARPEVRLWLVGKDPPPELRRWNSHPSITVTGTVPDIRPYLARATVSVAPLKYGAGIQNKILEAMACATPVITTPQTVASLPVQPGSDLLVAQEPDEFALAILELLSQPVRQRELGLAGRTYVERNHNWEIIAQQLTEIYRGAIEEQQAIARSSHRKAS